ncbi:hypothetical protein RB653_001083 [Dictyostelium firmibasis]|uniref:DH domain-containing protein n=1 Tax=Dictyostelium firmibasis TaxID=79012 RepID=A0AAN7U7T0_9MYCE
MSTGLKCSSCGASNNSTSKFCTSCGNKIHMGSTVTTTSSSSPTAPSKSFLAPTISKVTVTTTTTTTTARPASTIVKSSPTATTTARPASTIVKSSPTATTTTTTTTTSPTKSILKPTPPVISTTNNNNNSIPSKSILKPVSTTTTTTPKTSEPITRPKSHTISVGTGIKPTTTTPSSSSSTTTSFVKMAAKNRESLDSQAQRDTMVLQGAPIVSTPPPSSKSTLNIKKPSTTTTTSTSSTTPTTRPASMSVSVSTPKPIPSSTNKSTPTKITSSSPSSPSSPSLIDKQKEAERLEKQIQMEKEKFHQKEREIEQNRQHQYEKEKQLERERLEREKDKQYQTEREKLEREKQQQLEKEKLDRQKQHDKEERERQKQHDKEEREKLHSEREKQKQFEKEEKEKQHQERERLKQLEKEEKERIRKLEREKYHSTPQPQTTSNSIISPVPSSPSVSSPSLIGTINTDSGDEEHSTISNHSTNTATTTTTTTKKKRDKEKQKSRIFSLFSRVKDDEEEDDDELVISSPSQNINISSPTASPTPDSPNQQSFIMNEKEYSDKDRDSGDFSLGNNGGTIGESQLRKWAIKRNELQKSEGNLFAPSSPSQSSISGASFPIGSHSPNNSSGSLQLTLNGNNNNSNITTSSSSFIPSSSPSGVGGISPSGFQMGTSRISSPNPPPDLPNNLPQAIEQRDRVIEEIIVTEADYIRDLEIMVWLKKEMTINDNDATKGSTLEEINSLFSNVEQLLLVNKELYKKFCNFDSSFNPKLDESSLTFIDHIANGFVSMADFLKSYFVYCSNQQKALSTFSALKGKNCTYLAYLLTRRECRSLPFDSFLIKPVQRVCKYPLLIRELIKTTPQDSKSYENLINAQSKIESIVFAVNEKKREFDSQMKMLDIQNRIIESGDTTTKILSPSRKLIKEGSLQSWGSTIPTGTRDFIFKKKNKEGYYYLFNDLFIYAELKNDNSNISPIKVKSEIPFEYSVICDTPLDDCAFELKNKNLWCMFSLETVDDKQALFNEIETQMLSYQSILHEYQKYVDDRNGGGGSNRNSTISNNGSTAITCSNLSLSSNSITLNGASSSSSSSELLSIEEWKLLVKNKPLPALPTSNNNSPSISRISKALPTPPPPPIPQKNN